MTEEALVFRHDDQGVTTLTMNRPKARNALSQNAEALLDTFVLMKQSSRCWQG